MWNYRFAASRRRFLGEFLPPVVIAIAIGIAFAIIVSLLSIRKAGNRIFDPISKLLACTFFLFYSINFKLYHYDCIVVIVISISISIIVDIICLHPHSFFELPIYYLHTGESNDL